MKEFGGWFLPDSETHLIEWMQKVGQQVDGRYAYQYAKLSAALYYVRNFRVGIDVGAHIGLLSYYMAARFQIVHAFEPVRLHRRCFMQNVQKSNVYLHPFALSNSEGVVALHTGPSSTGDTYVKEGGEHSASMLTLDSFALNDVDFIKIDVEGSEGDVIRGATKTIMRNKPIIMVEQKGHDAKYFGRPKDEALGLLKELGMKSMQPPISGDWLMGF